MQAVIHGAWCERRSLSDPAPWPRVLAIYDALLTWRDDVVVRPVVDDRVPERLREAEDRGDLYANICHSTGLANFVDLARDAPAEARARSQDALARWSQRTFHVEHWWATLGERSSWWMVFDGLCIISDRPRTLSFDAERRLHGETGPAIAFSDGWGVHAWHGTRVPADWIDRRADLKAETVMAARNVEERRAGIEILGWDRIIATLPSRLIDQDADPKIGTLLEIDLPGVDGSDPIRTQLLRVQCGTGRQFAVGIDPAAGAKTALDAQAWLHGLSAEDFRIPQVRT